MSDATREPAMQGGQKLDISVKVYPVQDAKNLLANASVTIGGCFAIRGVRVMNSEKGAFVSMPQRKSAEGEYKDICFPTTAEMRKALNRQICDILFERDYTTIDETLADYRKSAGRRRRK